MTANCIAQDWALLVMAQDVWDPVNVVPSYSGFTTASVGTGTHVGYPSCGDISNPSVTDCQDFRMFGMDCSIIVNNTSYYYSNCDVSPGDSGGPMFRTISGTRYYVGNHRGGPVNDGCADGTCQTADCGTDSWLYGFQNDLRNTYSAITL